MQPPSALFPPQLKVKNKAHADADPEQMAATPGLNGPAPLCSCLGGVGSHQWQSCSFPVK